MARGLEVAAGHDLKGVADVNDQRAGLVRHVLPLLVLAPDLQTRDGNGEKQRRQAKVGVPVHPEPFRLLAGLFWHRSEQGVAEIALTGGCAVGLDVVPEVVVGELEDAGEQSEDAPVD